MAALHELEALVEREPGNSSALAVYADALQAAADPRGQYIALALAAEADQAPAQAKRRAAAYFKKHQATFVGELAAFVASKHLRLTWKSGFIETANIDHQVGQPSRTAECLLAVLEHPSARFIRELWVFRVDRPSNDYAEVVRVLSRSVRPSITSVMIGATDGDGPDNTRFGDLDGLLRALPNLQSLFLRGNDLRFTWLELPTLREVYLTTWQLPLVSCMTLMRAALPRLERLRIDFGPNMKPFDFGLLQPLLSGAFPLRSLGFIRLPNADEFCNHLARSALAPRLEQLELALCSLTDTGAASLATASFSKLELLQLQYNRLTSAGRKAVASLAPTVQFGTQYSPIAQ